ncbi:Endoplasmic reticulum transmembrane protein 3 [Coemansia sp. Benny D115]|nr:Endoplasmic reticulum transmembrane protein 3 [Coemansia sp. Benny D115]
MPARWKRAIITWSSRSTIAQRILYGVRIAFGFILLLFADAVMRLRKVQQEKSASRLVDEHAICQLKLQQFYAQRNTYLTGITMFLGLILISTHSLVGQLVSDSASAPSTSGPGTSKDEVAKLKAELADAKKKIEELNRKDRDMETLKKQADTNHKEYMRLADECASLQKKLDSANNESKKDA